MKVEKYVCNKCGEELKDNIFTLTPECLAPENTELTTGIPDEVSDELYALVYDKHLCVKCLRRVLHMAFTPEADSTEKKLKTEEADKDKPANARKYNKTSINTITELLKQGKSIDEVAEIVGSNKNTLMRKIRYHERKNDVQILNETTTEKKETEPEKKETVDENEGVTHGMYGLNYDNVVELYCNQDKNMHQTAKALGVSVEEVRSFIMKNRIFKDKKLQEKYDRTPRITEKSFFGDFR